ncbi:GNAT family N-acetyltransferase [Paenibacillus sp. PCH8]|uniref:GNAT family N-acetyltransferase n=1 Tax=Paenibacillus sp. PCH8 TaxID=2066524 RepID=UPI0015E48DDB|nr:GNAT family N-acetyltransferase [Paenibacillus sp. PCH8]
MEKEVLYIEPNHHGFFALGVFTTAWENKIDSYHIQHSKKITRTYYSFNPEKFLKSYSELEIIVQKPFEYLPLNAVIAQEYRDKFHPYYQLVWSSTEQFCNHGFGHFIKKNDQLISVCTSPYVGGGYAEIDIITIEEFKRQGLASRLAVLFIKDCIAKNLIPNWSCHADNMASNELAQKLGFEKGEEHPIYWYHV